MVGSALKYLFKKHKIFIIEFFVLSLSLKNTIMDVVFILLGLLLIIVGIIGCVVPGLPGPLSGWAGLLLTTFAKVIPNDWNFIKLHFLEYSLF